MNKNIKNTWKSNSLWPEIKKTLESGCPIVVYDLETTGLKAEKDRIIEIAAIKYHINTLENGDYVMIEDDVYHQYINPGYALPEVIVNLTGITDEKLQNMPMEADCIEAIAAFFDGCILCGYNIANFDNKFMNELYGRFGRFFQPAGVIDCIQMARNRLRKDEDIPNFKLGTVGAFFGIEFNAHSAIEDTRTTGKLTQIFIHEYAQEASMPVSKPASGILHPNIKTIAYWAGFKGFARIYVNTDIGSIYYDIRSSAWGGKDVDVDMVDMEWFEQEVFRIAGAMNELEFSKFKSEIHIA